jgi:hypothetical protein
MKMFNEQELRNLYTCVESAYAGINSSQEATVLILLQQKIEAALKPEPTSPGYEIVEDED